MSSANLPQHPRYTVSDLDIFPSPCHCSPMWHRSSCRTIMPWSPPACHGDLYSWWYTYAVCGILW